MSKMHGGKGDAPRPFSVDLEKFADNFDLIFGKKDKPVKTYTGGQPHYVIEPIPFAGMVKLEESDNEQG
jgi:hypothetical protein